MSEESEYGLIEPFDIDDGSLGGYSREKCFALGVEWAMIQNGLDSEGPYTVEFHSENYDRVKNMVERRKDRGEIDWYELTLHDDWCFLTTDPGRAIGPPAR